MEYHYNEFHDAGKYGHQCVRLLQILNLLNGKYTILEEKNSDWINVTPTSQEITITGKDEQNVNFTNKPLFIISDDFSAPELNTSLWTIFNPLVTRLLSRQAQVPEMHY